MYARQHDHAFKIRYRKFAWVLFGVLWTVLATLSRPSVSLAATSASNQGSVRMMSVVGFNGYYGKHNWVPIHLTIKNSGPAKQVQIEIQTNYALQSGRMVRGLLQWPVTLPKNASIQVELEIPGKIISENMPVLCVQSGEVLASAHLSGTALGNVSLVAVLSNRAQDAQFLTGSTDSGKPLLPVSVSPDQLPTSAGLLADLSAVAATPQLLNQLTVAQRNTLETWVRLGGLLLVTGSGEDVGPWKELFPLTPGPIAQVSGSDLATYVGASVPPPDKVQISLGTTQPVTEIWAGDAGTPLIVAHPLGRGMIVQTAFDPNQPVLLGWGSNAAMWSNIIDEGSSGNEDALPHLFDSPGVLSLLNVSDSLSPLRVPSLKFWGSVFLLYVVVMGPLLFFLLRRFRRETLAWLIVPVLSVVTTAGIYSFGALQRPSGMLTEGLGVVDLVGNQQAETYGVRAFMSPTLSSVFANTTGSTMLLPLSEPSGRKSGVDSVLYEQHAEISFQDIERWGVRYLYAAGTVNGQPELDVNLWSMLGTLHGTITNTTQYSLRGVALFWDGRMYPLGDVKSGQTISLSGTPTSTAVTSAISIYGAYNHDVGRGAGRSLGTFASDTGLLNIKLSKEQVLLVGTTQDKIPGLPTLVTTENIASNHSLALVRQISSVIVYPVNGVKER